MRNINIYENSICQFEGLKGQSSSWNNLCFHLKNKQRNQKTIRNLYFHTLMLIFDLCIKKTKIIGSYNTFQYSREIKATTSLTYNVSRTKKPIKLHKENIWTLSSFAATFITSLRSTWNTFTGYICKRSIHGTNIFSRPSG